LAKHPIHRLEYTGGLSLVILGRVSQDGLLGNAVEPIGDKRTTLPPEGAAAAAGKTAHKRQPRAQPRWIYNFNAMEAAA
jgi:hypothetical protein